MVLPDPAGSPQAGWDFCGAGNPDYSEWSTNHASLDEYSSESFGPNGYFIPVDSALFPSLGTTALAHTRDGSQHSGFQPFEQPYDGFSFVSPTHLPLSLVNPISTMSEVSCSALAPSHPEEEKEKQRCSHPDCGKVFKDLKAHMLTHQTERPEKCPITTCDYHIKGFARKYDKNRHTLTHYKGSMVCGFCPKYNSAVEKSFNRADVFKRHLTAVHGVEVTPPSSRRKATTLNNAKPSKTVKAYAPEATGKCSTCLQIFSNAQDFYEHLDECILRIVQQDDPTEAVTARFIAETEVNCDGYTTPPNLLLSASLNREPEGRNMCEDGCKEDISKPMQGTIPSDEKAKRKILVSDKQGGSGGLDTVRKRARATRKIECVGSYPRSLVPTGREVKRVKRTKTASPIDALESDASSGEEHNGDQPHMNEQEDIPILACPFYMHNPKRYQSWACARSAWKTVHRVKEHVYRKHGLPRFKCNRCYQEFKCLDQLNNHQRAETPCVVIKTEPQEGVSEDQILRLRSRKKPNGTVSEEHKWSLMYRIIFPKDEIVPSPYYEYYGPQTEAREEPERTAEGFIKELTNYSHHELPSLLRSRLKHMLDSSACDEVVGIALGAFQQILDSFTTTTTTKKEDTTRDPIKLEISDSSSVWDTPVDTQYNSKQSEDTGCGSLVLKGEGLERDWMMVGTPPSDSQHTLSPLQKVTSLLGNVIRSIDHESDQSFEEICDRFDNGYVSVGSMTISELDVSDMIDSAL